VNQCSSLALLMRVWPSCVSGSQSTGVYLSKGSLLLSPGLFSHYHSLCSSGLLISMMVPWVPS
jgi:hypothetical protein